MARSIHAVVVAYVVMFVLADMNKATANAGSVSNGNPSRLEAVQKAYWPIAVPFAFPFVSAVGIGIGGKLKRRS